MARPRNTLRSATKLKLEHIIRLELVGKATREIAASLGMTAGTIRELTRHPEYAQVRQRMLTRVYGAVDEGIVRRASEVLEEAAPHAADTLVGLLASDDEVTRRLSATAVLDRTGHGPIQRRAVRQRIELDPAVVQLLRDAMRESEIAVEPSP